jgi:hypothetical protein
MKKVLVMFIFLFLSIHIFGQEDILFSNNGHINFQNNDYTIVIALVDDLQKTLEVWNIPNVMPRINTTTKVEINGQIAIFMVYGTEKDSINLTYNLRMRRPNKTFSENIHYDGLLISDTVISKRMLYAASELPIVVFDDGDETGTYNFFIEVYDNNILIKIFMLEFSLLE